MKISEFSVRRYGPLRCENAFRPGDFHLFYGPNESGKTLILEALVHYLVEDRGQFPWLGRVDETPEGWIELEEDGESVKLPDNGRLSDFTEVNPRDLRNLLVVRDSDLQLHRSKSEHEVYTRITEELTGLRTSEIENIIDRLELIGKVTDKGNIFNTSNDRKGDHKLKDRYEKAGTLLENIREYQNTVQDENLDELYERYGALQEQTINLQERREQLQRAQDHERYEQARRFLSDYRTNREVIREREHLSEEQETEWSRLTSDLEEQKEIRDENDEQRPELEEQAEAKAEKLETAQRKKDRWEQRKQRVNENIRPQLGKLDDLEEQQAQYQSRRSPLRWVTLGGFTVAALGMIAAIVLGSTWLIGASLLFGIVGSVSGAYLFSISSGIGRRDSLIAKLQSEFQRFDVEIETVADVRSAIENFEQEFKKIDDNCDQARREFEKAWKRLGECVHDCNEADWWIDAINAEIRELKEETDCESLKELKQELDTKKQAQDNNSDLRIKLRGKLQELEQDSVPDEDVTDPEVWDDAVDKLEPENEKPDVDYDQQEYETLDKRLEETKQELDEIEGKIRDVRNTIQDFSKQATELLTPDGYDRLDYEDPSQLETIESTLQEFRDEVERRKNAALTAMNIFRDISEEQSSKIERLFGPDSQTANYLKRMSQGRYESVSFDREQEMITVEDTDGSVLRADQLSGGTYDQLYFAIRIALARKMFGDHPGFFLLDDAFVKSDADRLDEQFELVDQLLDEGWQVIYFSAKEEIKKSVENQFGASRITEFSERL